MPNPSNQAAKCKSSFLYCNHKTLDHNHQTIITLAADFYCFSNITLNPTFNEKNLSLLRSATVTARAETVKPCFPCLLATCGAHGKNQTQKQINESSITVKYTEVEQSTRGQGGRRREGGMEG